MADIIDVQFSYGVVLSNDLNNPYTAKCFSRQLSADESWIVGKVQREMTALENDAGEENASSMFDASSMLYQSAIVTCLLLSLFLIACGLLWENFYAK